MHPDGIPAPGAFGEADAPLGVHADGRWQVPSSVNEAALVEVPGGRTVRAFRHRPANYDAMFRASVARNPYGEAIVCGDRRLTYAELDRLVDASAFGLIAEGLAPGDRVAVMLDNRLEYLVAILATVRAGGIAVPLGTRLGPVDVAHIVGNALPILAVTGQAWVDRFPAGSSIRRLLLADAPEGHPDAFASLADADASPLPELHQHDVMLIVYTSGTTGKPKGACLTHFNFVHTCLHYLYALGIDRPQRSLLVVPGTHIAGFGPVMSVALACGGAIVMMREFKAKAVLETIAREHITFAVLVPAMYQLCLMEPGFADHDLSTWRYGVYGGAVMPPAVISRMAELAPALRLINAYGATETCAVCTIMPAEWTLRAPASVGLPLQCDDLIVVGEDGQEVQPGGSGELFIRGANVSPGYWQNAEATALAFRDGYWRSGDVATRDPDGLVYVHDRLKDMINRGGFKVFSAEVENALMSHESVADCAVVGVPDPVLGEKTFALVQRCDGTIDAEALRAFLKARIADYKVPDFWSVGEVPIPRNQNGKHQKAEVRRIAHTALESRR
ncbi:class I adenylate-forming enzyme family protein [Xanthobacter oligotrophicus]|uniref:class I adenylate-forming enzyme family protein n=1 Tax=Xanthobacter oligotrophicus TaxID=2607286 RepID=UPI0011F20457|nr:class I adenylate-forming enzyme family protein [Xanthobacter oligotrophicus]MCG5235376.1 acyl--CoA ligase [Xanthobacter oligotrophicus]